LRSQFLEFRYQRQFRVQSPDVLKIGHHGSACGTSAAFLDAVATRAAITPSAEAISSNTPRERRWRRSRNTTPAYSVPTATVP